MNGQLFLASQLARLAYLDGAHEGLSGMMACAFTIRNRVRAGFYNSSWPEVLSHHRDWSGSLDPYPDTIPDPNKFALQSLLQEIDGILSGSREDDITIAQDSIQRYHRVGAVRAGDISVAVAPPVVLYYANPNNITNPFFRDNICNQPENHRVLATIGSLWFWS